jgi:hypothetical protein
MKLSLYQILSLLGAGSLFVSVVVILIKKIKGIALGVQALLRAQLISDWNSYSKKGYAPIYAKENFENVYQQYHNLGANGVMDDIHTKFLNLPDKQKEEKA